MSKKITAEDIQFIHDNEKAIRYLIKVKNEKAKQKALDKVIPIRLESKEEVKKKKDELEKTETKFKEVTDKLTLKSLDKILEKKIDEDEEYIYYEDSDEDQDDSEYEYIYE